MSVSCSDCYNDLLCAEDSGVLSGESTADFSSEDVYSSVYSEESVAGLIEDERHFVPGVDYLSRFKSQSLDASAREDSVSWILKVQSYYNFQPLTAYLAVNYMDRFLYSHRLPQTSGWPMQLLAVSCLSLAAKMEEPLVPNLLDFQVEGAKYIFQPKTIQRMELLVLDVLDWRLRSVTPFSFLSFFACKIDSMGKCTGTLISRATQIILSNMQEANFLEYRPSNIAVAAILNAANQIPTLSLVNPENPETWCDGLSKEKIISCYRLMQELVLENSRSKEPKVIPKLRVTVRTALRSNSSSTSSSSSSLSPNKRRKLNNCLWVLDDDDKGSFYE